MQQHQVRLQDWTVGLGCVAVLKNFAMTSLGIAWDITHDYVLL